MGKAAKWALLGLTLCMLSVTGMVLLLDAAPRSAQAAADEKREPAAAQEDAAPVQSGNSAATLMDTYRETTAAMIAESIRKSFPRPNAVEWESVWANDNASLVCLTYRIKDGGDRAPAKHVTFARGQISEKDEDWGRHCARKKLHDIAGAREHG